MNFDSRVSLVAPGKLGTSQMNRVNEDGDDDDGNDNDDDDL